MRVAVCLHGGAVVRTALPLHAADRALVDWGHRSGLEPVAVELLAASGVAPRAVNEAVASGLERAVRVIDEALAMADAPATGLVVERVLRDMKADLVLFAGAADPDATADVPAVVAFRMGAPYVPGVFELALAPPESAPALFVARTVRGADAVTLALPKGAVVELDATLARPAAPPPTSSTEAGRVAPIRVVSLAELSLDPTLVRRRDDLRGVVEPTARPLVTTSSSAALAALLR